MRPTLPPHSRAALATRRALLHLFIAITGILAVNIIAIAQGFGILKIEGRLDRLHPPSVYLPAATVIAQVEAQPADAQNIQQRLRYDIERALNAPSRSVLSAASTARTLLITCAITSLKAGSRTEMRSRSEYKKTGEHTETDPLTNMTRTVDDHGWVSESYWVTISDGDIRAAIEVKDTDTGLTLDRGEVSASYHNEVESTMRMSEEIIRTYVADALVNNIAVRYAPRADSVRVRLPKGKLKDASNQLAEGRWNMALELLRAVPEFTDPHDEAYRLYSFGLAYEGLAYQQKEASATVALLRRAAESYADAVQHKADEGVFIEARLRVVSSTAEFVGFLNRASAFEAARNQTLLALGKASSAGAAAPPVPPVASAGAPGTVRVPVYKSVGKLTNEVVVRWVKVGISENEIVTNIAQSRSNDFDVSPRALARLKQAGVSDQVLIAMQNYQTPRQPGRKGLWVFNSILLVYQLLPYLLIL
jgi:hypothetical protein